MKNITVVLRLSDEEGVKITNLMAKFNAKNRSEAVRCAIEFATSGSITNIERITKKDTESNKRITNDIEPKYGEPGYIDVNTPYRMCKDKGLDPQEICTEHNTKNYECITKHQITPNA